MNKRKGMKLRDALKISRRFFYRGKKCFAFIYPSEKYQAKRFIVYATDWPMPDGAFEVSSEAIVKPLIRG